MKQSNSSWSIGRFWQTLNYFDVIPGLNFWKNLINPTSQNQKNNHLIMKNILVVNSCNNISQSLIENLNQKEYGIKLLNLEQNIKEQNISPDILESYILKSYTKENLKAEIFQDIEQIIYFTDIPEKDNLANLLQFITDNYNFTFTKNIFDFTNDNSSIKELWGAVDDVVMGGVSESNIRIINDKALFSGNVSTNNNGGFASVRTRNFYPVMNLEDYEGIELRVRGDGQRYKFITRCEGSWDGIGYCYSFDTVKDNDQVIRIPFSDLIPVFRAKTVKDAVNFNSKQVYSMQLMLSKFEYDGELNPYFQPGRFQLEVDYIKAYKSNYQPHFVLVSNSILQEDSVRSSGLPYTIIRTYESSESGADKVFTLQENNNSTKEAKEKLIAKICLETIKSSLGVNQTFAVQEAKVIRNPL